MKITVLRSLGFGEIVRWVPSQQDDSQNMAVAFTKPEDRRKERREENAHKQSGKAHRERFKNRAKQ